MRWTLPVEQEGPSDKKPIDVPSNLGTGQWTSPVIRRRAKDYIVCIPSRWTSPVVHTVEGLRATDSIVCT